MSLQIIRKALEKRLAALSPAMATAYENVEFTPVVGTPHQKAELLPAEPGNEVMGSATYFERGIFQVTLCYPKGTGPAAAEARAQLIRAHFKRGTTMIESGVSVIVTSTPKQHPAQPDNERYNIPISVYYQAQIIT